MALSNWWKQRNQFVSVYTQRFKVGFVFMCSFTQGTDRKWFQKMGRWKVAYLGFKEVMAKLGIGHL
jgi:hypothetical protein